MRARQDVCSSPNNRDRRSTYDDAGVGKAWANDDHVVIIGALLLLMGTEAEGTVGSGSKDAKAWRNTSDDGSDRSSQVTREQNNSVKTNHRAAGVQSRVLVTPADAVGAAGNK